MICDNISSLNNSQSQQNIKVEKKQQKYIVKMGGMVSKSYGMCHDWFFFYIFCFFFYLAVGNVIIIFDFKIISVFNSIFIYLLVCVCVCVFHISFFGDLHPELCCCCLLPLYLFIWKIFIMLIGFHIFPFTKTIFVLYKFFLFVIYIIDRICKLMLN